MEPINFALIQTDGVPAGPPGPFTAMLSTTFTPNAKTLLMNPGDKIAVTIKDNGVALETDVNDITTGTTGFMVASAANHFQQASAGTASGSTCTASNFSDFSFRPEFSSASATNIGPWESLSVGVNFAVETGHFELCPDSACSSGADSDHDDLGSCFAAGPVGGCFGKDSDFDGIPYGANWPDGGASHPSSVAISPPNSFLSGSYSSPFSTFNFQTNIPQSETYTTTDGYPLTQGCDSLHLAACTVPPHNTAGNPTFYPFYSATASCNFLFGNDQPATSNDYGKDAEYGGPSAHFFADFQSTSHATPGCPTLTTLLSSTPIAAGGSASDSATLAGGVSPTGTIKFFESTTNTCPNVSATQVGTAVTVSGNGVYPSSTSQTFTIAGTYYWYAVYSGDSNNVGVTSTCEPLVVSPITPTLTTSLVSTTITSGGSTFDYATLAGGSNPTGTITFFFSTTNTCPNVGATQVGTALTVSNNNVYTSTSQTFTIAGTYYWYAVYSGDSNNIGVTSACEPLVVNAKTTPTLTTLLSLSSITAGGSVSDIATLAGGTSPTGTITFSFSSTNTCPTGSATQVGSPVTVAGNIGYPSSSQIFSTPGTYYWYATYSGDANNNGVTSACEPLVVKALPALTTLLSAGAILVGSSASDTATLASGNSPTGTITFFFSTTNTCPNGLATQVGSPVTVSGNGAYPSSSQTFLTAGTYFWYATYSGDANNAGVTSACEPLIVGPVTPTLSTTLSTSAITVGGSASDSATLTLGSNPTGTITFFFSTGNSCPNVGATQVGTVVIVSGNGIYSSSTSQTFNAAGTFYWYATYSGDPNNNQVTSLCEPLVVKPTPTLGTTLSASTIVAGGSASDIAMLSGATSTAGGTITFFFSAINTCPNGGAAQVGSPVPVSGNGAYSSLSRSFPIAGAYFWYATYSGDANNVGVTSSCEPLIVKAVPSLTTLLSAGTIIVGNSASDTATLASGNSPTGTITFFESSTNICPSGGATQVGTGVTVSGNGGYPSSTSQTFNTAGAYYWYAIYSGDANNNPVTSACEPLVVSPASPALTTTATPSSENVGGPPLKDVAHLVGGFNPTGTMTFTLHSPTSSVVDTETVPVSGNGDYSTPVGYAPVLAGTYFWVASYSGDVNNIAFTTGLHDEPVVVSPASTTLITTPSPTSENVGTAALKDVAHLTGGFNPTGTITFTLTSPSSAVVDTETVPVSGNGDYATPVGYVPVVAGTYQWDATYSGDVNNKVAADIGATNERVTVSAASPTITTTLSSTLISVGGSVSDAATLSGLTNTATGTILFLFSTSNICPNPAATQVGSPVTVTGNGAYPSSTSQTFGAAGTYYWYATYSGDANNPAAISACEPLAVQGTHVGVPEFPTPMLMTTAISFLALAILMRTRKPENGLGS